MSEDVASVHHVRSRELRADGPPCDAPPFAFRRDDIRLLVRLDLIADWISLPFARRWKNNSSKSSSTGQFDWPPNQVRLASSTGQWLSRPTSPTNCDDPVHGSSPGETHLLWGPGET